MSLKEIMSPIRATRNSKRYINCVTDKSEINEISQRFLDAPCERPRGKPKFSAMKK